MAKTMTGSRAVVRVDNTIVGIYDSVNYAVNVGTEAIHLLGRFSAAEIAETSYEAINVSCSGFRLIGNGGHVLPKMPKLQDLLNLERVRLDITDRQTGETIATIQDCVPTSYNTGYQARAVSRIQVNYMGIVASDEDGDQFESSGAVELP